MSARTLPPVVTAIDPLRDDCPIVHWLVPGNWTRGRAVAHVAREADHPFTDLRARRVWYRFAYGQPGLRGWEYPDGTLTPCERGDIDAEPYWEVVEK